MHRQSKPARVTRVDGSVTLIKALLVGLVLCCALLAESRADSGAQNLDTFLTDVKTLRATFYQSLFDEDRRLKSQSTGTLRLDRPGKFRWTYDDAEGQDLISDGNKIWIHDRGLEQVTVRALDATLNDTPAALLTSDKPVRDSYTVTDKGRSGSTDWVELKPKSEDAAFTIIRVGFVAGVFRFMEIEDSFANLTQLRFDSVETNVTLADGVFKFIPPAGADVIEN